MSFYALLNSIVNFDSLEFERTAAHVVGARRERLGRADARRRLEAEAGARTVARLCRSALARIELHTRLVCAAGEPARAARHRRRERKSAPKSIIANLDLVVVGAIPRSVDVVFAFAIVGDIIVLIVLIVLIENETSVDWLCAKFARCSKIKRRVGDWKQCSSCNQIIIHLNILS